MAETIGLAAAVAGILGSMLVVRTATGTIIKDLDTKDRRVFTLEALSRQASAVDEALHEWRDRWYLTAGADTMLAQSYWGRENAERFKDQAQSIYEEAMALEGEVIKFRDSRNGLVKKFFQAVHLVAGKLEVLTQRMDFVEKEVGRLKASSDRVFKALHLGRYDVSPEVITPVAVRRLLDALRVKRDSQFRVLDSLRDQLYLDYDVYDEHLLNDIEGDRTTHLLDCVTRDQCPYNFHLALRDQRRSIHQPATYNNPCRQAFFEFQDRRHRERTYVLEIARVPCEANGSRSIKDVLLGRGAPKLRRQEIIEMAYGLAENLVLFPEDRVCTCRLQQYTQSNRLTPIFVKRQGGIQHIYPCFYQELRSLGGDRELHCLGSVLFDIALGQAIRHQADDSNGYSVFVPQRSGVRPSKYVLEDLIEQLSINPATITDSAWVPRDLADAIRGCFDVAATGGNGQARFENLFLLIYWPLFKQYDEVVYRRSLRVARLGG